MRHDLPKIPRFCSSYRIQKKQRKVSNDRLLRSHKFCGASVDVDLLVRRSLTFSECGKIYSMEVINGSFFPDFLKLEEDLL